MKQANYLLFFLSGMILYSHYIHALPDIEAWDHFQTPNVINETLFLEEDLTLLTDQVFIQATTQDVEVTSDSSVRIKGYKFKPSRIFIQPMNGFNVLVDVTENGLHFKGGSTHHTFQIAKNAGDGMVEFTIGNGRHLRFAPKKD